MDTYETLISQTPRPLADALSEHSAGIYAWWGTGQVPWPGRFPATDATRPLYVGKAEKDSISARVESHLGTTRWSAPRRSLAGLLLDVLPLRGHVIVKNVDVASKFGLDADGERLLTTWIAENLTLTWVPLAAPGAAEVSIIRRLWPPLNDTHAAGSPFIAPMRRLRAAAAQSAFVPQG